VQEGFKNHLLQYLVQQVWVQAWTYLSATQPLLRCSEVRHHLAPSSDGITDNRGRLRCKHGNIVHAPGVCGVLPQPAQQTISAILWLRSLWSDPLPLLRVLPRNRKRGRIHAIGDGGYGNFDALWPLLGVNSEENGGAPCSKSLLVPMSGLFAL
jgi:hypothetical protein